MEQLSFDDLEAWKLIPRSEGLYEVSSLGRVRSLPRLGRNGTRVYGGKILHPSPGRHYLRVSILQDGKMGPVNIHQLVAEAFLGPRPLGQQVRHGPGGPHDNRVSNLCYGTVAENMADKMRDGTLHFGSDLYNAKLTEAAVVEIRRRHANGEGSYKTLADDYGVSTSAVALAVRREKWKHVP